MALPVSPLTEGTPAFETDLVQLFHADCFDWLCAREPESIHAVVTDPPYGFVEYEASHLEKLKVGRGGVWRIPPRLGGYQRSPLPRFTVQTPEELAAMTAFFDEWSELVFRVLVPGAHVLIATNPLLANRLYNSILGAGFEARGEFIRLVTTLRGGDRPKGAEREFADVTVMPKSNYEPWGVFRKPFKGTVAANLRRHGTGGLRRTGEDTPFADVFRCPPASQEERRLAKHPTLKPQRLLRHLVRAALPLGKGIILDTFAGSGSTLAAAAALGLRAVGVERVDDYIVLAREAIPKLSSYRLEPGQRDEPSPPAPGQLALL